MPRERCARYRLLYALVLTGRQAHNDNGIWGNLNTEGERGEEVNTEERSGAATVARSCLASLGLLGG
jgi:hypothetical protein